jgi:hypothetical protein
LTCSRIWCRHLQMISSQYVRKNFGSMNERSKGNTSLGLWLEGSSSFFVTHGWDKSMRDSANSDAVFVNHVSNAHEMLNGHGWRMRPNLQQ